MKTSCSVLNPLAQGLAAAFALGVMSSNAQTYSFVSFPNNSTHTAAVVAAAIANVPTNAGVVYDANGQTNDIQIWNYGTLVYTGAVSVASTLQRIRNGQSVANTESDDGGFFNFNSPEFPNIPRKGNNYYMEFMVWPNLNLTNNTYTEGYAYGSMKYPGAMRLLIGLGGEVYFTGDHYGEDGPQQNAYYVNPLPGQAFGNSWTNGVSGKWETAMNWNFSVSAPSAAPSNCDPADLITNAGNKTVTLDAVTAGYTTNLSVLAINNLVLSAPSGLVNTLLLTSGFTNTLQIASSLSILSGGSLSVAGGLIMVNGGLEIGGGFVVSNGGQVVASMCTFSSGTSTSVVASGGTLMSTNVVVQSDVRDSGSVIVTNASHTGTLDLQCGTLILDTGLLQVDNLVITNPCALFLHTGGTLIVGNVVIAPNLFGIVSIAQQNNDVYVTWNMGPGATNSLQATSGDVNGNYSTNGFTDIFVVTNNPFSGVLTGYLDAGAATNSPTRYYRARLGM
ncbi:MAG: hypothetical protein ABSD58_16800 [Verrucomicrobiia bacterium]|jgi:hypothetical protein